MSWFASLCVLRAPLCWMFDVVSESRRGSARVASGGLPYRITMCIQAGAQRALKVGNRLRGIETTAHLARCPPIALRFVLRLLLRTLPLARVDVNLSRGLQRRLTRGRRGGLRHVRARCRLLLLLLLLRPGFRCTVHGAKLDHAVVGGGGRR